MVKVDLSNYVNDIFFKKIKILIQHEEDKSPHEILLIQGHHCHPFSLSHLNKMIMWVILFDYQFHLKLWYVSIRLSKMGDSNYQLKS